MMNIKETPVLLLTGYLGSGKTTLVNKILANKKGIKFAVIVNDIGEVNIDADLIEAGGVVDQKDDSLVALQNGCICCTLKMDLVQQLNEIVSQQKFDYIVIEASGICEPAPIAQTICAYPQMYPDLIKKGKATLDSIVTVVDARRPFDINFFDDFVARQWPKQIIRCKGLCYFANEKDICYVFEQAGKQINLRNAGQWYATMPQFQLREFLDKNPKLKKDWEEPYGDRMQKLVFIGQNLDKEAITKVLDTCLTDF